MLAQAFAEESRVFELKHRLAEEVVPLLWPIAGKENIAGQGRYITVKGSAKTIESVKEALTRLDIAPRLYQVTLKQERNVFANKPGSITYGTPGVQDESLTQTIQILEGHAGYMALQKTIPYADWVSLFGQWDSGLSASIAQETAVNGFFIKIEHRNSHHALVEIRTQFAQMGRQSRPLTLPALDEHQSALTTEVPLGQWTTLGTTSREKGANQTTYRTPMQDDVHLSIAIKVEEAPISPSRIPPKP